MHRSDYRICDTAQVRREASFQHLTEATPTVKIELTRKSLTKVISILQRINDRPSFALKNRAG